MELPAPLRAALDAALQGVAPADIAAALTVLSRRYRAEIRDGRLHLDSGIAALAYCTARMPATFAAARASLALAAERMPEFSPQSLLDCGAGPGTVLWAAADCWPGLQRATLLESSPAIRGLGEKLGRPATIPAVSWHATDVTKGLAVEAGRADLVTLSYLLDELEPPARERLADQAWDATAGVLVAVEPGTPAGWRRILALRERLLARGAYVVAPCPHGEACPIGAPDWCHFSRRVARARSHRLAKNGTVPWEDEKFIFLAASRAPVAPPAARVVGPPRMSGGKVLLKLCQGDGTLESRLFTRRDGAVFRQARRADWGDALGL